MGKFDKTDQASKKQVSRDGRPKRGRSPTKTPDRGGEGKDQLQPAGSGTSHLPPLSPSMYSYQSGSHGSDDSPGFEVIEPAKPGFEFVRIPKGSNHFSLDDVPEVGEIENKVKRSIISCIDESPGSA